MLSISRAAADPIIPEEEMPSSSMFPTFSVRYSHGNTFPYGSTRNLCSNALQRVRWPKRGERHRHQGTQHGHENGTEKNKFIYSGHIDRNNEISMFQTECHSCLIRTVF